MAAPHTYLVCCTGRVAVGRTTHLPGLLHRSCGGWPHHTPTWFAAPVVWWLGRRDVLAENQKAAWHTARLWGRLHFLANSLVHALSPFLPCPSCTPCLPSSLVCILFSPFPLSLVYSLGVPLSPSLSIRSTDQNPGQTARACTRSHTVSSAVRMCYPCSRKCNPGLRHRQTLPRPRVRRQTPDRRGFAPFCPNRQ